MPFGTITSTESTFGSISGTIVGAVPGTLSGSVGVPGPVGPVGPVGPQGPQGIPGVGGAWGSIVGTLSAQGDLWSALSSKYDASNPNGFITSTALVPYITSATAASTYQPLSGMTAYLTTASAASTYAPIAAGLPTGGTVGQVLVKNSGTAYDATFQTLIPGDRYVTTSTTSNSVGNGAKTFTVGTGLSYSSQQDVVISYDAANHMHAVVTSYNSGTGALVVDVKSHTGSGTYASWTVNVGGTTPLQTVEWGEILGVLGDQSDLAGALSAKLEVTDAASTYQTIAGMSSYLTTSAASSTYYPVTNPAAYITAASLTGYATQSWVTSQGYITSSALTPYAQLSGATFSGEVITPASTTSNAGLMITPGVAPSAPVNGEIWATTNDLQVRLNGVTETVAEQSWVTAQGYLTSAPVTSVAGRTGAITLAVGDVSGAAPLAGATFTGLVTTLASSTAGAGFRLPHGAAPTTPTDGDVWTTTGNLWVRINGASQAVALQGSSAQLSSNNIFTNASSTYGNSTAAGTINIGTGATISGATKAINIGTAGVSGSTTNITLGTNSGGGATITLQNNTTVNANLTTTGTASSISNSTATQTLSLATGATINGSTKTVNIGTGGVSGSTTNITIGTNSGGTSNTTLVGNTTGVTAAADTNSTALATTAYVVGQAGSATPLVDGTAAVGTSLRYARQDHVHPTDTSRAPLASPALTGTPTAPTATAGTNTTQIATTAFVTAAVPAAATHLQSLQFSSTSAYTRVIDASSQILAPSVLKIWPSPSNLNGTSTSGAGASASLTITGFKLLSPSAGVAGSARCFFANVSADLDGALWGGSSNTQINFGRRVSMAFRFSQFPSSTSSVTRVVLGKIHGAAVGDLATAGIGVKYVPNGANFDFQLQVHNGTTLTSVTSSTQYAGGVADLEVVSDGAGNAVLYLNGNQVASTTGAPTGVTSANATVFAEVESQATTANQPSANIGRLTVNTLNF